MIAEGVKDLDLVAGQLQIYVQLHAGKRNRGEMLEALLEGENLPALGILVIVGENEAVAVTGGQDIELDHVHAGLQSRVEAGRRVAGDDQVGPFVPDAFQR